MRYLIILPLLLAVGCGFTVGSDRAVSTMEAEGWTNVTVTAEHRLSPRWMGGCSKEDDAAFEVAGKNPAGNEGTATVCCGAVLKGCTIRH
ncbi:hypothetical protein A2304_01265 [Candidatus Uhrbacteria bacterium RIFOXYB2_FULL_57_15]|uniref:Lipoprotein n=1 Tax=Candidatus Uhrbacteria bacterium RIFOXYB2_FULL_57_15 TaxID=1802422 RepID=A0A1F7W9Y9_9BACT|nr:MAG: hypothetical protein A2304_01265 [Candidatus Uhrbacteria bacterium RIFOXYB2_FULL_57_15]OGL99848.1 MAG: hypothetical protein A2501_05475 [Candidatus Uhrbacteria bacterium RIFOXYC12_FULL_57_11]